MLVNTFCRFSVVIACVLMTGCGGMSSSTSPGSNGISGASTLPAASSGAETSSDLMRVGDKITIRLTGVPDSATEGYIIETQIPSSGDITVPLIKDHAFHAAGRTASDVADEIMAAYKADKIYTAPVVTIISEERFVSVGGDVHMPQRVMFTPDLTLLGAINACGGFTEYAKRGAVRILRGQQVIQVDANAAARNPGGDPPLRPGDQVYVPRTMF
jgi:polysaccharide export outer membrane protein